jgi:outer membrane protein
LATDSSTLITNESSAQQFLLQLKALLNLDAGAPFDVETPPVERIPVESLAELQPEFVYNSALINLPQQKVNELRIQSAIKTANALKAAMYPSLGAFGGLDTRYVNTQKIPVYDQVLTGYSPTAFRTNAGGGVYYGVEQPVYQNGPTITKYLTSDPFSTQLRQNFGQNIGIGLSIPILNGRRARTDWEKSKLTIKNLELTKLQGDQQLKQDIYKAYIDAAAAIQKFNANQKAVQTAQKAYDFANKRYDLGMLSTFELLSTQNTLMTAKTQALYAQYDYVFKMKLLEFYKGQGLKL